MTATRLSVSGPPRRLDHYLRDHLGPGFGRRRIAGLLRGGAVRVNGRRTAKAAVVTAGDEITIDPEALAAVPLVPHDAPITIVHHDDDVVAIDKPPGMPSTAGPSGVPSVAAALLARYPEMAEIDPARAAGLVHRLDTGTSGLLLAARTADAHRRLRDAFAAKRMIKEYLAVVHGRVADAGVVTLPLVRRPRSRRRMIVAGKGWNAATEYRPLAHADDLTLVHLRMRTGVTHQLRVHLAATGHPVVGDRRYGAGAAESHGAHGWHYLHALRIRSEDDTLAGAIATPFPRHWLEIASQRGWSAEPPPRW